MKSLQFNTGILRTMALLVLFVVLGCAEGVMLEDAKKRTATDRSWEPIEMTKSQMGSADVTIAMQTLEMLPGESPEAAIRRTFGVSPVYDVRKLLDSDAPESSNTQPSNGTGYQPSSGTDSQVCNDSCVYSNDGVCDEPTYCAPGTDCSDCAGQRSGSNDSPTPTATPSCPYEDDGICDVPTYCPEGTDVQDCQTQTPDENSTNQDNTSTSSSSATHPNSCQFANDGYCDEPTYCAPGTDTNDCLATGNTATPNSAQPTTPTCAYENDGVCDVPSYCPQGTDVADCSQANDWSQPANDSGSQSNTGDTEACRWANDGVCDEPTYCAVGTDTADCSQQATNDNRGSSSNSAAPGPDSCQYANDQVCDEPTYCAFGTDTSDCQAASSTSAANTGSSSASATGPDSCRYAFDGACDEPTYCAFGTDTTDCNASQTQSNAGSSSTPSASATQAGGDTCVWANDGACDEPTICAPGTDATDCGFSTKEIGTLDLVDDTIVVIGWVGSALVYGIVQSGTWVVQQASHVAGFMGQDSMGRQKQVQVVTDPATIEAARQGRLSGISPSPASGNVGVSGVHYLNQREAEGARAEGQTCSSATHSTMNEAKDNICKYSGPRKCKAKQPSEDRILYCAEVSRRISRGSRCVQAREDLNRVCYGGLGHPDSNGNRTENDTATNDDRNALINCQQLYSQQCAGL